MPQQSPYAEYQYYVIAKSRGGRTGVATMPVAGRPGVPCTVVRLDAGEGGIMLHWIAGRIGAPPVIPSFKINHRNYVPLAYAQSAPFGVPAGGGQTLYSMKGVYSYGLRIPEDPDDAFYLGKVPIDKAAASFHQFPSGFTSTQLVDPRSPVGGVPSDLGRVLIANLFHS